MNTEKLEKLKKSLDNKFIPDNMKEKIRAEIQKLETDIKKDESITATEVKEEVKEIEKKVEQALEVAEKKEEKIEAKKLTRVKRTTAPKSKAKTVRKTTTAKKTTSTSSTSKKSIYTIAKEIRKPNEAWKDAVKRAGANMRGESKEVSKKVSSELEKLKAFVKRKKELKGLSGTNLLRDSKTKGQPKGKRVSDEGNVYYEYRDNRTDRLAPNYPKNAPLLAGGGGVGKKGEKIIVRGDDFTFLLKLSDKELQKRLDLVNNQKSINAEQYFKAKDKKENTSKIEEAGTRLDNQWYAIVEARNRKNKNYANGGSVDLNDVKVKAYKGFHGLQAENYFENVNGYDWNVVTMKRYGGDLVSSARGGQHTNSNGVEMFTFDFDSPNIKLVSSKPSRVTEKVVELQHALALQTFKEKMESKNFADGGYNEGIEEDIDMTDDYVLRVNKGVEPKDRASLKEFMAKTNESREAMAYELGGAFMTTDLAGHTGGGTAGLNSNMPLSGVSGTHYTGLVGETGALSSGEMFAYGGGVGKENKIVTIDGKKYVEVTYSKRNKDGVLEQVSEYKPYDKNKNSFAHGGGVHGYMIVEGFDSFKNRPLYQVVDKSDDTDYVGEYHTTRKEAEEELKDLVEGYARGGSTDRKYLNHSEDYEVRYAKGKNRHGYGNLRFAGGGSVGDDFEEIIDLGAEQYYTRPFGIVESESNGEVELVAVATIKDLEDYISEDELPEEGNFQLDITLVPTEQFISDKILEIANDEDTSISDDSVLNVVNYAGGLNYSPHERVFFKTHQGALNYLMSDELKEQINRDSFSSDYIMYKKYNRLGQTNSEYLDYLMGVKDRFARGGGVRKVGNREYSLGRNWTNDHNKVNKSEKHEVNYSRKGFFANGGAMMANQQIIDDASQHYVNYYLNEGATAGMYKKGGSIPNNYAGRTPMDVWENLTKAQKAHFIHDHIDEITKEKKGVKLTTRQIRIQSMNDWFSTDDDIKNSFGKHFGMGQYATGGMMPKVSAKKHRND